MCYCCGIVLVIIVTELQTAVFDDADAAPSLIRCLKNRIHYLLCGGVALVHDNTSVLIVRARFAAFELNHAA